MINKLMRRIAVGGDHYLQTLYRYDWLNSLAVDFIEQTEYLYYVPKLQDVGKVESFLIILFEY